MLACSVLLRGLVLSFYSVVTVCATSSLMFLVDLVVDRQFDVPTNADQKDL